MSNDADSVESSDNDNSAAEPELKVTAEAMAEATEAIAGSESEDSLQQDGTSDAGGSDDLAKIQAERDQYFDQMKRAQAELDNYRRRMQREAEQMARYSDLPLIRDLLPALDNISRTIQAAEQTGKIEDLIKGLQMVVTQVDQVFGNHSATPITALGEIFDPNRHEALQQIPTNEQPPMTVLQELERGYIMHDRVIRPTKVLVACAVAEESTESKD